MKKITVTKIVEFNGFTKVRKLNFVNRLKNEKDTSVDGGGHYWTICLSAILKAFKLKNASNIIDKINEYEVKKVNTNNNLVRLRYEQNIAILRQYVDFDFRSLYPSSKIKCCRFTLKKKEIEDSGIIIKAPNQHCVVIKNEFEELGAIWFLTCKNGYEKKQLAIFANFLYDCLNIHFSDQYRINSKLCRAIDVKANLVVNHSQIERGVLPDLYRLTLKEIQELMK